MVQFLKTWENPQKVSEDNPSEFFEELQLN